MVSNVSAIFLTVSLFVVLVFVVFSTPAIFERGRRNRRSVDVESKTTVRQNISCDKRYGTVNDVDGSCLCYWPSLVGDDAPSDCSLTRACNNGAGKLVHTVTRVPLDELSPDAIIDIHDFECDRCGPSNCFVPGKDPLTGLPSCVPTRLANRSDGLCVYEGLSQGSLLSPAVELANNDRHTDSPVLAVDSVFVDKRFAASFKNAGRHDVYVPNPCSFDAFSGVSIRNECRLALTPSGIGYCESLTETVSTIVFDDDYLVGNGGRYSNSCFKFTADERNVSAYVIEYFVRPRPALAAVAAMMKKGIMSLGPNEIAASPPPPPPPLPVISLEIAVGDVDAELIDPLGLRSTLLADPKRKVLIGQAEIPDDVEYLPTPFDKTTMSLFVYEHNDFVHYLPTTCAFLFKCLAPVQKVKIPSCDRIDEERDISGFTFNTVESGMYDMLRQQHVVACREPRYDRRLAIVPNIDVHPSGAAYNANPTSAILRFDKNDRIVRPYWFRSFFIDKRNVYKYLSNLPSRPALP